MVFVIFLLGSATKTLRVGKRPRAIELRGDFRALGAAFPGTEGETKASVGLFPLTYVAQCLLLQSDHPLVHAHCPQWPGWGLTLVLGPGPILWLPPGLVCLLPSGSPAMPTPSPESQPLPVWPLVPTSR